MASQIPTEKHCPPRLNGEPGQQRLEDGLETVTDRERIRQWGRTCPLGRAQLRDLDSEVTIRGTNTGSLILGLTDRLILGTDANRLPPTAHVMDIVGTGVLEVSEAKVTAERHYWPALDGLVQLGLLNLGDPVTV